MFPDAVSCLIAAAVFVNTVEDRVVFLIIACLLEVAKSGSLVWYLPLKHKTGQTHYMQQLSLAALLPYTELHMFLFSDVGPHSLWSHAYKSFMYYLFL